VFQDLTMSVDRLRDVVRIFQEALTREGADRAAYLDAACGADAELRREVDSLLAEPPVRPGSLLDSPPWAGTSPSLAVGERIGPYEVVAPPRRGGMGAVYRARDTRLGRSVALKVLDGAVELPDAARDRFKREARAIASLDHPNICALYDVGSTRQGGPGGPVVDYLVMEYLDGETLHDRLARRDGAGAAVPLPVDEALAYGIQVSDALATAHHAGIVHRDLKPSNIMLVPGGAERSAQAKLLDFGLAKHVALENPADETRGIESVTVPGTVLGTLGYHSPEQARGEHVDARTDLFAFGAVLFEMLTGRPAFTRGSAADTIAALLNERPPRPSSLNPHVPATCDIIVEKALEKDRELRYQSAAEIRADARRALRELSGHTPFPSSGASHALPVSTDRRRRLTRWSASVAAVLIVALAVAWGSRQAGWWGQAKGQARGSEAPLVSVEPPFPVTSAPGWEDQPAPSPDGSMVAYVSNESGNPDVWIVGVRGGNRVQITHDAAVEELPAWYPDGTALVYAVKRGGSWAVWKAPPLGGSAEELVPDARDPAISPDASSIAFVRSDGEGCPRVHVAPLTAGAPARILVRTTAGPCYAESHPAWSPDGLEICFAGDRALWVAPASGGTPHRVTTIYEYDREPAWVTAKSLVFSSYRQGVFALWQVAASGTPGPERITRGAGSERNPGVSKDGRLLAFSSFAEDEDLVFRDVQTGQEVPYASTLNESSPSFCGGGAELVFARNRLSASGSELYRLPLSGWQPSGESVPLATGAGSSAGPQCSPDGQWVAYFRVWQGRRRLWAVPLRGGTPAPLTDAPADNTSPFDDATPSWDPKGRRVTFASTRGGGWDIWVMPVVDGKAAGEARKLTFGPGTKDFPQFSPDGKWIVFAIEDALGRDIATVAADGSGAYHRVTKGVDARFARWIPGTNALAVTGTWGGPRLVVRRVSLDGATDVSTPPLADLGPPTAIQIIDISPDGHHIVFSRGKWSGDIYAAEIRAAVR
jgi:eukaryotic-like serine/threonine-protein kinase